MLGSSESNGDWQTIRAQVLDLLNNTRYIPLTRGRIKIGSQRWVGSVVSAEVINLIEKVSE